MREFVRRIAEVLDHFVDRGIVHADLKPDNILIKIENSALAQLKLIDFGSSFFYQDPEK